MVTVRLSWLPDTFRGFLWACETIDTLTACLAKLHGNRLFPKQILVAFSTVHPLSWGCECEMTEVGRFHVRDGPRPRVRACVH